VKTGKIGMNVGTDCKDNNEIKVIKNNVTLLQSI
jgi:hypothetical protein